MYTYYSDILSKMGDPLWWDENAVPRYKLFEPQAIADIYATECALAMIACQNCSTYFSVCISHNLLLGFGKNSLSKRITSKSLSYGDPPNSRCCPAGPTMGSIMCKIIQYWHRGEDTKWLWARDPIFEIHF
jgi:hypothetical protein